MIWIIVALPIGIALASAAWNREADKYKETIRRLELRIKDYQSHLWKEMDADMARKEKEWNSESPLGWIQFKVNTWERAEQGRLFQLEWDISGGWRLYYCGKRKRYPMRFSAPDFHEIDKAQRAADDSIEQLLSSVKAQYSLAIWESQPFAGDDTIVRLLR